MKTLVCKHTMGLFISLALGCAFGVPSSMAQQKIKVAGKMTAASTKQEVIAIGDVEGHIISLASTKGFMLAQGNISSWMGPSLF